jgi:2-oxoglutarate dehydrogenase E1 component
VADSSHDESLSFGTNQWLVEEMYERYSKDPASVDPVWVDYFANGAHDPSNGAGNGASAAGKASGNGSAATGGTSGTASPRSNGRAGEAGDKPANKPANRSTPPPKATVGPPTSDGKANPRADRGADTPRSAVRAPDTSASRASTTASEKPQPVTAASRALPKDPVPLPAPTADNEPETIALKGASARTVANMDASLSVPTATSVRSIPVKLLIDNRIVINNHLARARGGKVSFTHVIGYALVKAIAAMPDMNVGFDDSSGKPALIRPAHVNLGLAIDLPSPTARVSSSCRRSRRQRPWTSPSSGRPTRTSYERPATASWRSLTSRARR